MPGVRNLRPAVFVERSVLTRLRDGAAGDVEARSGGPLLRCEAGVLLARCRVLGIPCIAFAFEPSVMVDRMALLRAAHLHRDLCAEVARAGGRIDGVYVAPLPGEELPPPRPRLDVAAVMLGRLVMSAAQAHQCDLARSCLLTDVPSGLAAARASGVASILVGRGAEAAAEHPPPDHIVQDLLEATTVIDALRMRRLAARAVLERSSRRQQTSDFNGAVPT
jgi:hypothetical protein